jgi:predicted nucleic acid-binding Zn ribbon protein
MTDGSGTTGALEPEEESESLALYARLKSLATGTPRAHISRDARARAQAAEDNPHNLPFSPGRDPRGLSTILGNLTREMGWTKPLAQSTMLEAWPDLVGPDIAAHARVAGVSDGVLTISCESTAWASALRLMSSDVLTKIATEHPESGVTAIRFLGPDAPSWKRGPKSVPGRGPRDTYG